MRTLLVTGSDTGIGKTRVVAALVRLLSAPGRSLQVVKVVETGVGPGDEGDAASACRSGGGGATPLTLASFPLALAPATAAAAAGRRIDVADLLAAARALPACDWRIYEGAGGIASPIDGAGHDWADFAFELGIETVVLVVPDRLGAINQARLVWDRAQARSLPAGLWLNAIAPVEPAVAESNRTLLRALGLPIWAEQSFGADGPAEPQQVRERLLAPPSSGPGESVPSAVAPEERFRAALAERDRKNLRRSLRVSEAKSGDLNLADNDYLALAQDPAVVAAGIAALAREGTSASASPLITGWRPAHAELVRRLGAWHGFAHGLLWSSGYAANAAVLGVLPAEGDLIVADRLIHHSMVAGLRRSGARWQRYPHLDLDRLEAWVTDETRPCWVVTESLFSMDGDFPDLARLAELKRRHGFRLVLDEAHALGWYGPEGAGLARAAGIVAAVDVFVATLGKTLASGGAYTLFHDPVIRDYLVNSAGEFIYSTALPPAAAAIAAAAVDRVVALAPEQARWHELSREFRRQLGAAGWSVPAGDSPIIPVRLDAEDQALNLADFLRSAGIHTAAVRPPTVPAGTSRLRLSLKRGLRSEDLQRVLDAMGRWRAAR